MKISVLKYIEAAEEIFALMPNVVYDWGSDGSKKDEQGRWKCDCRGYAVIWTLRKNGLNVSCPGTNYCIRNQMTTLTEVANVNDLLPGMVVFKCNDNIDKLPLKYKKGGKAYDPVIGLINAFHIGIVISVNPLVIYHCSSGKGITGILKDTKLGKWNYAGYLKYVDKGDEPIVITTAKVIGGTLNLRAKPSTDSNILCRIPNGSIVQVIELDDTEWTKIQYSGKIGFVMSEYLELCEESTITLDRDVAETFYEALKKALGK